MAYGAIIGQNAILPENILGTLSTDQIPNLDASKITSGTFSTSQIPNLDASKITSGTLPVNRGGTGVTSISDLKNNLGLTSGVWADPISFNFNTTTNYDRTGTNGSGTFSYEFSNSISACMLYINYNASPAFNFPRASITEPGSLTVKNNFGELLYLILNNLPENPVYSHTVVWGGGISSYNFSNTLNITLSSTNMTFNQIISGSSINSPSYNFNSNGHIITTSGFVVPIYSN